MHSRVTPPTWARRSCDSCGGRPTGDPIAELGLEPTPLEREPAHASDCPQLRSSRFLRAMTAVAALAVIPVVAPQACHAEAAREAKVMGLDDGTVGRADDEGADTSLAS